MKINVPEVYEIRTLGSVDRSLTNCASEIDTPNFGGLNICLLHYLGGGVSKKNCNYLRVFFLSKILFLTTLTTLIREYEFYNF